MGPFFLGVWCFSVILALLSETRRLQMCFSLLVEKVSEECTKSGRTADERSTKGARKRKKAYESVRKCTKSVRVHDNGKHFSYSLAAFLGRVLSSTHVNFSL